MSDIAAAAATTPVSAPPAPPASGLLGQSLWSKGSFSFKDLLDIVNPLQHIPVVGSIYRYLTGDEPAAGTRIIGDALYGGPIGFGASVVSTALLTDAAGHDVGERLLADVFGPRDQATAPGTATLGKPQLASAGNSADPAGDDGDRPLWLVSAGTPDGQPATPRPARARTAALQAPTTPTPSAGTAAATQATGAAPLSMASAPAAPAPATAALQPAALQPLAQATGAAAASAQSFGGQLFRSPPPAAPATPEQAFLAQRAQFQRQITQGRGTNGAVLNNRPVPLELSSNLLPVMPAGGHLALGPGVVPPAANSQAPATTPAGAPAAPDQPSIAQKMMDALAKYEQLKKQEEQQQDSGEKADPQKVDLAL